ncbi:nucleolus and neural progenitor protein isoform X1 [Hydra vulgaris]|uniref:nucleolus and neural progenitor protein isoform X1 n=1 Tax=Hydra vulgaris TaxID=6087 RepID=UPI001F5F06A8|nr:nucleolus and neural progenitor protein [Hydra vulgaris]
MTEHYKGWNQRLLEFNGQKADKVLWKDANLCKWEPFYKDLSNLLNSLRKQSLEIQSAIISRVLYKHQNQMRRDIPFQYFKKVSILLLRLIKENLLFKMTEYLQILSPMYSKKEKSFDKEVLIPSKEYTAYIFERILGCSKLSVQILICCQKAFLLLDSHIRHGFFVSFNLFGIASVSRIWTICLDYINNLKLVFNTLKGILRELFNFKVHYTTLDQWLNVDFIGVALPTRSKEKNLDANILNKLFGSSKSFAKDNLDEQIIQEIKGDEILGEPISWETFVKEKYGTVLDEKSESGVTLETTFYSTNRTLGGDEQPLRNVNCIKSVRSLKIKCPVCKKIVRRLRPSLCPPFHVSLHKSFSLFNNTKSLKGSLRLKSNKICEALIAVKHALLHAEDLNRVKLLFMRYRQLRKKKIQM